MKKFIERQKKKPEHVRKRIALLSTLGIFFVIVNIWWVKWTIPQTDNAVTIAEVASPLAVVMDMVFGLKGNVDQMAEGLQDQIQSQAFVTNSLNFDQTAAVVGSDRDIVYPEQVFGERGASSTTTTLSEN